MGAHLSVQQPIHSYNVCYIFIYRLFAISLDKEWLVFPYSNFFMELLNYIFKIETINNFLTITHHTVIKISFEHLQENGT